MPRTFRRFNALAPLASLGVMLVLSVWLPNRVQVGELADVRKAEVAGALHGVPYLIGPWVGRADEEIPPEAQKLLRPNAIFSRVYRNVYRKPSSPEVRILVVHCNDARDMIGHYPPVCYPSAGWVRQEVTTGSELELDLHELRMPVREYRFHRLQEQNQDVRIRVFNAFVLPDGTVTTDIDDINRTSERLAVSVQGVAQLQVITPAGMDRNEAAEAAAELLRGMPDLLAALRVVQGSRP